MPVYLGLMLLALILNCYVESADKSLQWKILVAFFLYQVFYGWFFLDEAHFINGYSASLLSDYIYRLDILKFIVLK